jgi:hypothetical protein
MQPQQIANRLVELCNKGDFETAQKELFDQHAVSIEPHATEGFEKETKGLDANLEKGKKFQSLIEETHSCTVSEPIVVGNVIALALYMDVTMKGRKRMPMNELIVYQVKDGKIISEQFFV